MCGGQTETGYHPESFVRCKDVEYAKTLLRAERRFVRWNLPSETQERASLWFKGGEPYEGSLIRFVHSTRSDATSPQWHRS